MKAVFRVDSSPTIGVGHLLRCIVLALELQSIGYQIWFLSALCDQQFISLLEGYDFEVINISPAGDSLLGFYSRTETEEYDWESDSNQTLSVLLPLGKIDWLVVDHYMIDYRWHRSLRKLCSRILVLDDLANRRLHADLIVDPSPSSSESIYHNINQISGRVLLGPQYALLRKEFLEARKLISKNRVFRKIHVSFGGGDSCLLTSNICHKLCSMDPNVTIEAVVPYEIKSFSPSTRVNIHIKPESISLTMLECDLAVGSPGTMLWERFCLGLPTACFSTAENQIPILKHLESLGYILYLGDPSLFDAKGLSRLSDWINNTVNNDLRMYLMDKVDGKGGSRIALAMAKI